MAIAPAIRLPVRPDMSKMYRGMALFHEALAEGYRQQAELATSVAKKFNALADQLVDSDNVSEEDIEREIAEQEAVLTDGKDPDMQ